jgi:DUF2938 family protein
MISAVMRAAAAGSVATLTMDVLSGLAVWTGVTAPLPPGLVGRWFACVARMHVFHDDIARTAPVSHEMAIALPVHYMIGVCLTSLYLLALSELQSSPRTITSALAFGLATNLLPWFVMFPSMGYGFFGVHGPAGTKLFLSSLLSHAFFGLGIWLGVRVAGIP